MALKLMLVLACVAACASAGIIPYEYPHYAPLVVHKPVASSYSYFHKVDHSVPIIKTVLPAPIVYKPLYHPLPIAHHPLPLAHDYYHGFGHHF